MKKEQILKKAIEKAVKNGWKMWNMVDVKSEIVNDKRCSWSKAREFGIAFMGGGVFTLNDIIFNHGFARAFFGTFPFSGASSENPQLRKSVLWQHYQHQMLTEIQKGRSPIKYLAKFL